ncbi:hypothetical protein DVS28_a2167 [Euzebya pacifica]|uniref:Uncharacterized protein n=1 Tax=Euzebya pacifica TaxID=1608957 RepID=A0A346XXA2_9ACTN|nr:hypothetical protein DVS28_a2167 [Euzebya pacifica]
MDRARPGSSGRYGQVERAVGRPLEGPIVTVGEQAEERLLGRLGHGSTGGRPQPGVQSTLFPTSRTIASVSKRSAWP